MSAATCPVQPGGFSLPQMAFARGMSQSDSPCSLWLLLAVVLPTWGQRHCCAFPLPNSFRINIKRTKNGGNSMKIMAFHPIYHHLSIFSCWKLIFQGFPVRPTTRHLWVGGTQLLWSWWQGWPVQNHTPKWDDWQKKMRWNGSIIGWKCSDSIIFPGFFSGCLRMICNTNLGIIAAPIDR